MKIYHIRVGAPVFPSSHLLRDCLGTIIPEAGEKAVVNVLENLA
jgi:hypothetical protein